MKSDAGRGWWKLPGFPSVDVQRWLALVLGLAFLLTARCSRVLQDDFWQRSDVAAHKGIQWIIAHRDDYPEGFYAPYLRRFYRITADAKLAERLLRLASRENETHHRCTPDNLSSDSTCHSWTALRSVVLQAYQLKCSGQRYEGDVERIREAISVYEMEFLPAHLPASERIVAAFYLGKLGLRFRDSREMIAAEIRQEALSIGTVTFKSRETLRFAMDLTHLVFTASDYFGRYVTASQYEPEVRAMRVMIGSALEEDLSGLEIDAAAELLSALKLLRQPADEETRRLSERLARLQNRDGSWGDEEEATSCPDCKVHRTEVVAMALLAFATKPREKDPWCESEWQGGAGVRGSERVTEPRRNRSD